MQHCMWLPAFLEVQLNFHMDINQNAGKPEISSSYLH